MAWLACMMVEADSVRRRIVTGVGLATLVAVSLVSGHPETTFYSLCGVALLAFWRLASLHLTPREVAGRLVALAGGVVAGVVVTSAQTLPLLEYLANRAPSGQRQAFVDTKFAGMAAFPFLNGSSFGPNQARIVLIGLPYIKGVEMYMAAGFVLLALMGLIALARRHRSLAVGLGVLGLLWLLFILDVKGFGHLVTRLPVLNLAMALRTIPLWAMGVSLLAALGVDDLARARRAGTRHRHRALVELTAVAGVVVLLGVVAYNRLQAGLPSGVAEVTGAATVRWNSLVFTVGWFLVALAALYLPLIVVPGHRSGLLGTRSISVGSSIVLLVALFAASGFMWRDWSPTVTPSSFYARSSALGAIQNVVGDAQTLRLDATDIAPDMNLAYRVHNPESYDAIEVGRYDTLYRRLLRAPVVTFDGTTIGLLAGGNAPAGVGALRILGIRYVTTTASYPFADHQTNGSSIASPAGGPAAFSIKPTFLGASKVNEIVVSSAAMQPARRCTVTVGRGGEAVSPPWRGPCGSGGLAVALPERIAVGSGLVVSVGITDRSGATVSAGAGSSVAAIDTKVPGLGLVAQIEDDRVYQVPGAPGLVFSPASTVAADPGHRLVDDAQAQPIQRSFVDAPHGASRAAHRAWSRSLAMGRATSASAYSGDSRLGDRAADLLSGLDRHG